jgi:hypothetical protein
VSTQIRKSRKRYAADLIELVRKDIEELNDYTLSGAITHIYREAADRGLPWATDDVEKLAIDAMDRAVLEWQQKTGDILSMMKALPLITAAQKRGYDLFGKALSFLRETLEIRNLGEADPRPYEAEVIKFFEQVVDPGSWSRFSITLRGTDGGYSSEKPSPPPPGLHLHEMANLVGQKIVQAYRDLGSGPDGITIRFF